ncbi:MAG: efflux RND transporter periplasmic adaptor subunit [Candidatus Vecturithrix sp.]|jgi:RND family efflux transporter MFP subunit|nr:efflux RND transporter periplasmic adaptor subunit [Candidatus Vecturithrix sp.]
MKKNILLVCLLITLCVMMGYVAYSFVIPKKETSEGPEERSEMLTQSIEAIQAQQGKPVKVATVTQETASILKIFYGTVVPYDEVNVQGKYSGKLVLLKAKEGDTVVAGEVIVRFDESDTKLQLQQAVAAKNATIQGVKQAESTFQLTQTEFHRYQQLLEDGYISRQTVDTLRNQLQVAQAALQSAREQVKTTEAQIRLLENTLKDLKIRAPISGIIDEKYFNLSEIAGANKVIYHIVDINQIYVEVQIPELYISRIGEQMEVEVTVDSLREQAFAGIIDRIIPTGNPQNRQFTAKVLVANPEHVIKPGMFARVSICLEQVPEALVLNPKALLKDGDQYFVFKVIGEQVKKVAVQVKHQGRDAIAAISDELTPHDRVVIEGVRLLQDNDHINLLEL